MKNVIWLCEGYHFSTPMRKVLVCNGNEPAARSKAKKLYGFTRFTEFRKLGQKKEEEDE